MSEALLSVKDLRIQVDDLPVVDGVSLTIASGETLAVVGESGCGKSMTSLGIIRLLPEGIHQSSGEVFLGKERIDNLSERKMNQVRGSKIGMIFQEPVASLDPLMPVGKQITEALRPATGGSADNLYQRMIKMLERVGIDRPELRAKQYPFELSGGMCQRIMIATAMIREPSLLIADEPTTALDVTIQKQILELMSELQRETGAGVLLITHDMGVVAESADRVAVMYAGKVVETGTVKDVLKRPRHPYTAMLLRTIPRMDTPRKQRLPAIAGAVPDIRNWPKGCRFNTRCPLATSKCFEDVPPLEEVGLEYGHLSACWHSDRVSKEILQ